MSNTNYAFNPQTSLWYEITAVSTGTGVTLNVSDVGVSNPPPYVPSSGEPLITQAQYMAIMGLTSIEDTSKYLYASLAISDIVERRCHYSWRTNAVEVPAGLQVMVARATALLMSQMNTGANPGLASESFTSYSYSTDANVSAGACVSPFYDDLKCYTRPFLGM